MVNPKKYTNNLNEDDLNKIYNKLNIAYKSSRDLKIKKNINQQILIFILACRRLSSYELVRIPYKAIENDVNDIIYKHLSEQVNNNFCSIDDLLLTDANYEPLKEEDIDQILGKIKIDKLDKKITVSALNVTKSRFNEFNKKNINKRKLNKFIEFQNEKRKMNDNINSILKDNEHEELEDKYDNITELEEKLELIDYNLQNFKENFNPIKQEIRKNTKLIDKLMNTQKSFEESYYTNINQLNRNLEDIKSNVIEKIENTSNNISLEDIKDIKNNLTLLIENQKIILKNIKNNDSLYRENLDYPKEEVYNERSSDNNHIYEEYFKKLNENEIKEFLSLKKTNNKKITYENIIEFKDIDEKELKTDVIDWLCDNIKISYDEKSYVEDIYIINKLRHYFHKNKKNFDEIILQKNLTDYISSWYYKNTKWEYNEKLIYEDEYGVKRFPRIRLISNNTDITAENANNKFLSIIITWLKENTVKSNGFSSYNEEILDKIRILFEKEGWEFIHDYEEYSEFKNKSFKVIYIKNFSQLIGKAIKKIYPFINDRTVSVEKNRTRYPNIKIKEKYEIMTLNHIKTEFPEIKYEDNNQIYDWILNNIKFTNKNNHMVNIEILLTELRDNLGFKDQISDSTMKDVFLFSFNKFHSEFSEDKLLIYNNNFIIGYEYTKMNIHHKHIINSWIINHIEYSNDPQDKILIDVLKSKVTIELLDNNISVVNDLMYSNLPDEYKKFLITKSSFEHIFDFTLKNNYPNLEIKKINGENYVFGIKMYLDKLLTENMIKEWIKEHITIVDQPLVLYESKIIEELENYMITNKIRTKTDFDLNNHLLKELNKYYLENKNEELVVWHRNDEKCFESLSINNI